MAITHEIITSGHTHEASPKTEALSVLLGENASARELRSEDNNYGYLFERYDSLLFGDGCLENLKHFLEEAAEIMKSQRGDDPVLQLAALSTCLDISQAAIRVADGFDTRYPDTQLSGLNLREILDDIGQVVRAVRADTALAEIVKEKIDWVFETYKDHPTLEVDIPMRNYETDVLGSVILLKRENDPGPAALFSLSGERQRFGPIEGQPTLFAKGMLGFRDTVDHIAVAAAVNQADIERRARHSYESYITMPLEQQEYLSGIFDYEQVVDIENRKLVIENAQPLTEVFGADNKMVAIFQEMHRPIVRAIIENSIGVSLKDITLENQSAFLRFCLHRSKTEYDRLSEVMLATPQESRILLFETFLATEFGDDYGDAILDIAEKATPEQSAHVFELLGQLREGSHNFAHMFASIDPELAGATEKAMNERITDVLAALQEVVNNGSLHEDVAPHRSRADYVHNGRFDVDIHSVDEALEIVEELTKTFATIHDIISAKDLTIGHVNENDSQFILYRLKSEQQGQMMVYVRPEGAYGHDRQVEYGNFKGVEASISFMVDPKNPHRFFKPKDPDAVSIRFDREGRLVDEAPDSDRRDPTRKDGLISVDLSSGLGKTSALPVKIGRLIAAGNRIRARRRGTEDSLHHNTNYFDQEKYGDSDGFAQLARGVVRQIELLRKTLNAAKVGQKATQQLHREADLPLAA